MVDRMRGRVRSASMPRTVVESVEEYQFTVHDKTDTPYSIVRMGTAVYVTLGVECARGGGRQVYSACKEVLSAYPPPSDAHLCIRVARDMWICDHVAHAMSEIVRECAARTGRVKSVVIDLDRVPGGCVCEVISRLPDCIDVLCLKMVKRVPDMTHFEHMTSLKAVYL